MSPITHAAMDRVLDFLAPLFLSSADGDPDQARQAARETVEAYHPRTEREVRFAALSIAFSLRALDALGRAAHPDQDVKTVLRLHGSANTLHRAAAQCERTLDRSRQDEETLPPEDAQPLPASTQPEDLRRFIQGMIKPGSAAPAMSRQQRRDAQRHAGKAHRQQKAALRAVPTAPDAPYPSPPAHVPGHVPGILPAIHDLLAKSAT